MAGIDAHLPILIPGIPLTAAVLMPLLARARPGWRYPFALLAFAAAAACALWTQSVVMDRNGIEYWLGGWAPPIGIGWRVDPLSAFVASIAASGLFLVLLGLRRVIEAATEHLTAFYSCLLLMHCGFMGMIVSADLFNIFVFLEVASLTAYALLGMGHARSAAAAYRYLLLGTVGASFYLLGVGCLYALTGTLNMDDMALRLQPLWGNRMVFAGLIFIVAGLGLKAGAFPLHGWLPGVYAYGPAASVCLIAPFATKISVYLLIRMLGWVFPAAWDPQSLTMLLLRAAGLTALIAAPLIARVQTRYRLLLAYSSIGQIGMLLVGISLASGTALTGVLLAIMNDMFCKSVFFLTAAIVALRMGSERTSLFTRLRQGMPFVWVLFVIAALSQIGIPPTAGFFAKWYLIVAALEQGRWVIAGLIAASALLSAAYLFVLIEQLFGKELAQERPPAVPVPAPLAIALTVCSLSLVALGLGNYPIVTELLQFVIPRGALF